MKVIVLFALFALVATASAGYLLPAYSAIPSVVPSASVRVQPGAILSQSSNGNLGLGYGYAAPLAYGGYGGYGGYGAHGGFYG